MGKIKNTSKSGLKIKIKKSTAKTVKSKSSQSLKKVSKKPSTISKNSLKKKSSKTKTKSESNKKIKTRNQYKMDKLDKIVVEIILERQNTNKQSTVQDILTEVRTRCGENSYEDKIVKASLLKMIRGGVCLANGPSKN